MLLGLFYGLLAILTLTGLVTLIYYFASRFMHEQSGAAYFVLLPVHAHSRDAAGLMYAESLRLSLLGSRCRGQVIALDFGIPPQARRSCEMLCFTCDNIHICKPEELSALCESFL